MAGGMALASRGVVQQHITQWARMHFAEVPDQDSPTFTI